MPRPYHKVLLEAVERSGRSARDISLAAVGHESAVRSLRRGLDLRVSTVEGLCRELGLEFHVGPPRSVVRSPDERTERSAPYTLGTALSASDEKALGKLLRAIAKTWRMAPTSWQREALLMSLSSSRKFMDDWFAGRPNDIADYDEEEMRRAPPGRLDGRGEG